MEWKKFYKRNKIFILIIAVVLIVAYISIFSAYIGSNPFAQKYELENPVKAYCTSDCSYYITDSGNTVLVTDNQNRIIHSIYGGDENNTFSKADCIALDSKENIYICDKLNTENASFAYQERIIKFNANGKRNDIVFKADTLSDDKKQNYDIYNIKCIEDELYFISSDNNGIYLNKINDGESETVFSIDIKNAYKSVLDADFDSNMNISYAMKNGNVYTCSGERKMLLYNSRDYDNDDYFSLVSEVSCDESGKLFLTDVGLKNIFTIDENGNKRIAVECGDTSENHEGGFSDMPIYTGLTANSGKISFLSAEYVYENDKEIYKYNITETSYDGNILSDYNSLGISFFRRAVIISVYLCIMLFAAILIYSVIQLIHLLKNNKPDKNIVFQLTILATALVVTFGVSYVIFDNSNSRYINESGANLVNTAYRIAEAIDKNDILNVNSPDAYDSESISNIDEKVCSIIGDKNNSEANMYCVIYTLKNNTICEIYRDDGQHSPMYPMAGSYQDSIEEKIANENDFYVDYGLSLSEGTYIYSLVPVYSSDGENIAFIETGTDYGSFNAEIRTLYFKVLMLAAMAVIIFMLMFSEFLEAFEAVIAKRKSIRTESVCPPEVIRPLSFLFFFVANFSTAFLPVYGMRLWNEDFPIKSEIAAALPLSAEFIFAALSALAFGFIIQKTGVKAVCILGGICYIGGSITAAFAGNLWLLILSNVMCGIGSGCLSIAFNTWAAGYDEEEKQNRGFIHINAAYLAGLNCGTVIGSIIWENFGVRNTFLISAAIGALLIVLTICMVGKVKISDEDEEQSEGKSSLKELFEPSVLRFFICILTPYLICTAFLEYFFPVLAEENNFSAMQISMAFLISGMISIYTGASLAENITKKLGVKRAMVLASFIYASALFYLVLNPTVYSCYIVIALFAIADSFGLSAQSVYFSSLPAVIKVGQSRSLGVNNTIESITSASGSLIFGAALMLGNRKGIMIITVVFAVLMGIFILFERNKNVVGDKT